MPETHTPKNKSVTPPAATSGPEYEAANTSFTLGVLSLALVFIPFVGVILAALGLGLGLRALRTTGKTEDGYVYVRFTPMAQAHPRLRKGIILSIIGFAIPVLVLFVLMFGSLFR